MAEEPKDAAAKLAMDVEILANWTAFPRRDNEGVRRTGLSIREYFAGQAMQGLLATGKYNPLQIMPMGVTVGMMSLAAANNLIEALAKFGE
mgnify:FL=1